jgi:hypothetical protein
VIQTSVLDATLDVTREPLAKNEILCADGARRAQK